jgi:hypothetical protein
MSDFAAAAPRRARQLNQNYAEVEQPKNSYDIDLSMTIG